MMFESRGYRNGQFFNNGKFGKRNPPPRNYVKLAGYAVGAAITLGFVSHLFGSVLWANGGMFDRLLNKSLTKQEISQALGRRFVSGAPAITSDTIKSGDTELQVQ